MIPHLTPDSADALLFDLGHVVIDIDFKLMLDRWAAHAGRSPADIAARFSMDQAYERHEIGAIDAAAYFDSLRTSLGIDLTHAQFLDGLNAMFIGEMPGMSALLARAAQRLPLYALSNTNVTHVDYFTAHYAPLLSHFREIFASSTIGFRKPDRAAYDHVVQQMGVARERIVFFDDLIENIEAARAYGMIGVHVTGPTDVADAFDALGI